MEKSGWGINRRRRQLNIGGWMKFASGVLRGDGRGTNGANTCYLFPPLTSYRPILPAPSISIPEIELVLFRLLQSGLARLRGREVALRGLRRGLGRRFARVACVCVCLRETHDARSGVSIDRPLGCGGVGVCRGMGRGVSSGSRSPYSQETFGRKNIGCRMSRALRLVK